MAPVKPDASAFVLFNLRKEEYYLEIALHEGWQNLSGKTSASKRAGTVYTAKLFKKYTAENPTTGK